MVNPVLAKRVAAYRLAGRSVEVWRGDALTLPADVALFGRCGPLRARLETIAGRPFSPAAATTIHGRHVDWLPLDPPHSGLPWRLAVSLDYRPRSVRLDARFTLPNLTHIDKLSDDLFWAIGQAVRQTRATETVLLLPLSHRNPCVVAVAQVLAVWSTMVHASSIDPWRSVNRFWLIDQTDPGPFLDALNDRDAIVTRALRAAVPRVLGNGLADEWSANRFKPE